MLYMQQYYTIYIWQSELIKFEQKVNEERKHREKELETKKEMVKQKLEFHEKNDRKVKEIIIYIY